MITEMPRQFALVMAFWLALWLPGHAVMRRWLPEMLQGGPLSTVALSYLASFALLSPIALAGYALRLPIVVFSDAIVIAVLIGASLLARDLLVRLHGPRPRWTWGWPSPIAVCAVAIVVNDALAGLATGSPLNGDAHYHVARIRVLVDAGFNSWDPLAAGRFDGSYHTNLYHALMAAACPITGLQPADVWVGTLFFAKLFASASIYHLAWVVFGQRWPAWIAAATFAVSVAAGWLLVFLNNVSMYGPLALTLAFAVQLLCGEHRRRAALGLGVTLLLLPQFHGMAYVVAAFTLTPLLLARLAILRVRKQAGRRELLIPLLCMVVASIWLVPHVEGRVQSVVEAAVARIHGDSAPSLARAAEAPLPAPRERRLMYRNYVEFPDGRLMYEPGLLINVDAEPAQLVVALALGLLTRRRRRFAILAVPTVMVLTTLLVPALCTVAFRAFGAGWLLARLMGGLAPMHAALVPVTAMWLLVERLEPLMLRLPALAARYARALGPLVGLAAAFALVQHASGAQARWPWRDHWDGGTSAVTLARIQRLDEMRAFYSSAVEPGAMLIQPVEQVFELMMTCNCYPLTVPLDRGDYGVADMMQRRLDLRALYGLKLSLEERVKILRRYDARYILIPAYWKPERRELRMLYAPIVAHRTWGGGGVIFKLSLDPRPATPRYP